MKFRPTARRVSFTVFTFIFSAACIFVWQNAVKSQGRSDQTGEMVDERPVTVNAAKRGNPTISFEDGRDLSLATTADTAQGVALTSADFDSDGVADVVVADTTGNLRFLKGNDRRNLALDPTAAKQSRVDAFVADRSVGTGLGFAPDNIFSGDLNADGKSDLMAVSIGSSGFAVVMGDGNGDFSEPLTISLDGSISALALAEIGRPDGQADVVVGYSNENGHFVAVYEHPEGAFKNAPEVFKIPGAANSIVAGNMDEDFYSDIAISSGNDLTIIHGRGQVYPWNLVKEEGIERPSAVVDVRRMPFTILSMAVGRFGDKRGTSLAALAGDGSIYQIESAGLTKGRPAQLDPEKYGPIRPLAYLPTDSARVELRAMGESVYSETIARQNSVEMTTMLDLATSNLADRLTENERIAKEKLGRLSTSERQRIKEEATKAAAIDKAASRDSLIDSVRSNSSRLHNWKVIPISQAGTYSSLGSKAVLRTANVSSSHLDDLMVIGKGATNIAFASRMRTSSGPLLRTVQTSIESSSAVRDVVAVRSNLDAIDDLVVLRDGSAAPSIVMSVPMNTFVVDTLTDTGSCSGSDPCSLRGAIAAANSSSGSDTILFNVTGTIAPLTQLPVIQEAIAINGIDNNGTKLIEISGANIESADGLKLRSSNSFIYGFAINRFKGVFDENGSLIGGNAITLESTTTSPNNGNNFIYQNFLGTDVSGTVAEGNQATGILVFDSDENAIQSNVLSGNNTGLAITAGNFNFVGGNIAGLNSGGVLKVPNLTGMLIMGSSNRIGGDNSGDGNTVSGNGVPRPNDGNLGRCNGFGVYVQPLFDVKTSAPLTLNNDIKGNRLGTSHDGSSRLGNCFRGLQTYSMTQTIIGSITETGRNTISGNGLDGLWCNEPFLPVASASIGFCSINGNNIGTDITGAFSIPNDWTNQFDGLIPATTTVYVANGHTTSNLGAPGGTTPGGPCTGFCNLVSGNNSNNTDGSVAIVGFGTAGAFNNFLGTNRSGTAPLPNNTGIHMNRFGTRYVGYGDATQNMGNLISGNNWSGIQAAAGSSTYFAAGTIRIERNLIGTDTTGSFSVNSASMQFKNGVYAYTEFLGEIRIGGDIFEKQNVISGNAGHGVLMTDIGGQTNVVNNKIGPGYGNQQIGNGGAGVMVTGDYGQVGGPAGPGNEIAYNGTNPIEPFGGVVVVGGILHSIRGNSIHDNIGLGIDVSTRWPVFAGDGVTANDCLDADFGVNGLQNYPVLLNMSTNGDGDTVVVGYLRSQPSQDYKLDFYRNISTEPSNHGEGGTPIGTLEISTNGSGFRSFEFVVPPGGADNITATATDSFGNTSEFSCHVGACIDPVRPAETLKEVDELYAVSICADPIVVNITTDEEDTDLLDETCDTDDNTAGSQCSLRAAIQETENQPGANAITFNIPGAGPHTITPSTAYPVLNQPVSIDAASQPGYSGVPLVIVNGINTTDAYGFAVRGGASLIRGFSIVNFKEQIGISGSGGGGQNRVGGNYVGIFPDGATGNIARQLFGITLVGGASNNQIGGVRPEHKNIIGATNEGISIASGSTRNTFNNNYVGIAADGMTAIPNNNGIVLRDSDRNNVGGFVNTAPNIISFNQTNGIVLFNSSSNRISGNLIGTNDAGNAPAGNKTGVNIETGSGNNVVGGTSFYEKNVISGHNADNNSAGVVIRPEAGAGNTVAGNYLGVSLNGDAGIPNRIGIAVNADNQYIGNPNETDYRNLIVSANTVGAYGIYLHPFFPNDELDDVTVQNNTVGTLSFDGQASGQIGVYLFGNVKGSNVTGNTVGHQSFAGIRLFDGPHNNTISSNRVGIKTTNEVIPNYNGIAVRQADTNFIKDNVVSGNTNHGIVIGDGFGANDRPPPPIEQRRASGSGSFAINNVITGNKVGTDMEATFVIANANVGIGVGLNARDTRVGGPGAEGNVVAGSAGAAWPMGIFVGTINDTADGAEIPHNIKVEGNRVGVGLEPNYEFLANGYGIYVRNAANTIVGGDTRAKGNIVGNNYNDGIRLFKPLTTETVVTNNYVGVLPDRSMAGNGENGISIDNVGNVEVANNVIGGNLASGVFAVNMGQEETRPGRRRLFGSVLKVVGNQIGAVLDENGVLVPVGNGLNGIHLDGVIGAEIGNALLPSLQNMISGNSGIGMLLQDSNDNKLVNNVIGTGRNGEVDVKNLLEGLKLLNSSNNTIGGAGSGNTISGNGGNGVTVESGGSNKFFGNSIGVFRDINNIILPRSNDGNGILILDSAMNEIGSTMQNHGNILASNQQIGIMLTGIVSSLNRIHQNKIGVIDDLEPDPRSPLRTGLNFGNGSHGVLITNGANLNSVGGPQPGTGNTIAGNGGIGVWIDPTAGTGNLVDPNSIYGNSGLGIDLGEPGHTANDPNDSDEGPNRGQNYPEITANQILNNELIVTFKVESSPGNSNYGMNGLYIEFFKADLSGEGERFIGWTYYTVADHGGSIAGTKTVNLGDVTMLGINGTDRLTATASDADNNTSEFFPPFGPSAAGVSVSGRVTTVDIQGISKAVLTLTADDGRVRRLLTNGLGHFKFEDIETGRTYVLTVSHKRYVFENPSRVIMVSDDLTDVDFIASQ